MLESELASIEKEFQ
jgi:hypothetical protein